MFIVVAGVERFAYKGVASNLVTYLTDVVKLSNSSAAKTVNSWCGVTSMLPLLGALLADSYWDRYSTILASSFLYVVGLLALTSTAFVWAWMPLSKARSSSSLFCSLYLISIGQGGYNPCLQAFGADQLEKEDEIPCNKLDDQNSNKNSLFFQWWLQEKPLFNQDFADSESLGKNPNNGTDLLDNAKAVLRLLPIWTMLLMFAIIFQQPATFFTKQGMTMKRKIGKSFMIPPATLQSAITISIILLMPLYDMILIPAIRVITRSDKGINVMQRMGTGMVLSIISMVIAAIVETKRLKISRRMGILEPLSIFWLLPQYILLGISDVFMVVGMQEFFYTEVPRRMRTMGIALYLSVFGVGSLLSALVISIIETVTTAGGGRHGWFSDDMREARLDKYYWLLALSSSLSLLVFGENVTGLRDLKQYLEKFGYLDDSRLSINVSNYGNSIRHENTEKDDIFNDILESAIKTYQLNYHLNVTGSLDSDTVKQMTMPRCGVADIINGTSSMLSGKKKQQHHSSTPTGFHTVSHYSFFPGSPRWPSSKVHLTYGFHSSEAVVNSQTLRSICSRAFTRWSVKSHFTFEEAQNYTSADIQIGFHRGDHGDGAPFDGPGGVLAHAFAPTKGAFHYDAGEKWATDLRPGYVHLESVTMHEIGHLLGLGHSSVSDAIMYPTIPSGVRKMHLHEDDIHGIRALYALGI
ncbi:hypothetical protein HHK36_007107 [Tetracentron sinense]|uniref:Peptidase metallopeptidase domain-containing protein n=1 Tax=Tetracentron sinense TaxID=13715 RepID=A0A834ZKB6_TETSI|nr:hypothetical protein HHK36_007107 [Tetracentron sinense]